MSEINNYAELRERLAFYSEDDYRNFIKKGIPSERPFLGVRIPIIRSIMDLVPREYYAEILKNVPVAFEEVVARGVLICKMPYDEMLLWFDSQIEYIDDWCACDTFCMGLGKKLRKKEKEKFLEEKVEPLLDDSREFAARAGLVFLKCRYLDFEHLNLIFDRVERMVLREEYYVRMALAWLVAECFVKFPEETFTYLTVSNLPKWTFNKAISKICDSYRVEEEAKAILKKMRK